MANHQINLSENGKVTLTTAGKYCDRNIDVNVNVPSEQPTPFTNLFTTAIIKKGFNPTASGLVTQGSITACGFPVPTGTVKVRIRGNLWIHPSYSDLCGGTAEGSTYRFGKFYQNYSVDEHGDWVYTINNSAGYPYMWIPLGTDYIANLNGIITANEPIGNGGHVG